MSPKAFLDLPLNAGGGRSAESFIFLAPGTTGNTFDAHINGSQTLSKEIQLEGLSMTIAEVGGDPRVLTLPPDALQEMSIATGSYSAEFGNSGGGVERFTIRSGTNNFHGNLYEFLRNDVLDARDFFQASRSDQPPERVRGQHWRSDYQEQDLLLFQPELLQVPVRACQPYSVRCQPLRSRMEICRS